ncbi:MAG: alpha-galactosidase [Clostridia bacterium]|nr:alpha-galactosidase [Clostridia bacterium]
MIIKNGNTVHLQGREISYIMMVSEKGDLLNFHFGKRLDESDYSLMYDEWKKGGFISNDLCLDELAQEYPSYGYRDLRMPAYEVENIYGNMLSQLKVKDFIVHENETAQIEGMPSLFAGDKKADTLEVVLCDDAIALEVHLYYTVFDEYNIIARNAVIINKADANVTLKRAYSASIDLPKGDYDMITFPGAWGDERNIVRTPLKRSVMLEAETSRYTSHNLNSFVMIAGSEANEDMGDVYGFSLIYSGNHSTAVKTEMYGDVRIMQGINPFQFKKELKPGESFATPQSVICYSDSGFGKMSREYHDVYRNNLMRSKFTHMDRPILINNWEATYFEFDEEKLVNMAKIAHDAGIELFVLDDGWFGKRDTDNCSLGDWVADKKKLPNGIEGLAEKINAIGMKFGLWFEPEMVSPDSDLYRAHPDWAISVKERTPIEGRQQLILDLSKNEVCEYIIEAVSSVLRNANVEYVKWDFNRMMTDMPYPGFNHAFTLGFYKVMKGITEAFPNVLFEGCCSGGGRFDPGVLAYMPQIWTSDNSDAVARMKIQYGTSMCYPPSSISSHVTAVPNHQCGRLTSLDARADTAYIGTFGYELDITQTPKEEIEEIRKQIAFDKKIQPLVREGDFYRLQNPFDSNFCSWQMVSKDKKHTVVYAAKILVDAHTFTGTLKLKGLDPDKKYKDTKTGAVYSGAYLMYKGKRMNYERNDFSTEIIELVEA